MQCDETLDPLLDQGLVEASGSFDVAHSGYPEEEIENTTQEFFEFLSKILLKTPQPS